MGCQLHSSWCVLALLCLPACSSKESETPPAGGVGGSAEETPANGVGNSTEAWAINFGGDSDDDPGRQHVVASPDGSVLVGGEFRKTVDFGDGPVTAHAASGSTNSFFAKFTSEGKLAWKKTWDADGTPFVLTSGSEIVGGVPGGFQKLDKNGDEVWKVSVDAEVSALAAGPSGELLVAGATSDVVDFGQGPIAPSPEIAEGKASDPQRLLTDIVVAKLRSNGDSIWTHRVLSELPRPQVGDVVRGLAVDAEGNSVLAVGSAGVDFGLGSVEGVVLAKLDTDGQCVFSRSLATDSANFRVAKVALDSAGDIYLVGRTPTAGTDLGAGSISGIFAAKFTPAGELLWSRGYGGDMRYVDAVVGPNDTLYIAGNFVGTPDFGNGALTSASEYGSLFVAMIETDGNGSANTYGDEAYNVISGVSASTAGAFVTGFIGGSVDFGTGAMVNRSPSPDDKDLNVYLAKLATK